MNVPMNITQLANEHKLSNRKEMFLHYAEAAIYEATHLAAKGEDPMKASEMVMEMLIVRLSPKYKRMSLEQRREARTAVREKFGF